MTLQKFFLFPLFLFFFVLPQFAQKNNFNRRRDFDVQHYTIRVKFDRQNRTVLGETTVQLKPLKSNFTIVELDAVDFNYSSIRLENSGKNLSYRVENGEKLLIQLDKDYTPKDLISIRISYSCQPRRGVFFISALQNANGIIRDEQIWTQNEPEDARHWFPSFDFPDDKATSEQFVTVDKDLTVIANGTLLETKDNADETKTVHYKMSVPHSTYLTSFVVGKYVRLKDSYKKIPLGFYVYPGFEETARKAFGKTKNMMRVFETLTGVNYPFNKYDQTIVAEFKFGGMENITATTHADQEIFQVQRLPNEVENLISHELAHSWFGNLVTMRNWSELWLNESFATFMEAAYREKAYGRENYLQKIRDDVDRFFAEDAKSSKRYSLFNLAARPDESIFTATNYEKGSAVLHTLREEVGDRDFWKAVNVYLNRHKFGNVETLDWQKVLEEVSGQSLDWFFAQWIYRAGYPRLEIKQIYQPREKRLDLIVAQRQKTDDNTPQAFILPMEIEINTASGTKTGKIKIEKRTQGFSISVVEKPLSVIFDKNLKIPLKTMKISPLIVEDED